MIDVPLVPRFIANDIGHTEKCHIVSNGLFLDVVTFGVKGIDGEIAKSNQDLLGGTQLKRTQKDSVTGGGVWSAKNDLTSHVGAWLGLSKKTKMTLSMDLV